MAQTEPDKVREVFVAGLKARRKLLGSDATFLDAARQWHWHMADDHGERWEATKNPVWAWRCLTGLNRICVYAATLCPELQEKRFVDRLPDWCEAYLLDSAYRIDCLIALRDFHTSDAMESRIGGLPVGPLRPADAARAIPSALGFVRRGWNAIDRFASEQLPRLFLDVREVESAAGRKPSFSKKELMDAMGWNNDRTASRKLAAIRKGTKRPQ